MTGNGADNAPRGFSIVRLLQRVLATGLGVALVWAVVTYTYVAYLAERDPERALKIRRAPEALLNASELALEALRKAEPAPVALQAPQPEPGTSAAPANAERLRGLAELATRAMTNAARTQVESGGERQPEKQILYRRVAEALKADPMSARGLRLLAQLSEGYRTNEEVASLMRMAAAGNVHEAYATYWLMITSLNARAYADSIRHADALLRTQRRMREPAIEVLARISETPDGLPEITRLIVGNPPWRAVFFDSFSRFVTDGRTPLQLLLAIKDTPYPPTSAELGSYLSVLIQNHLYELAYYAWLQFLPPGQLSLVATPFNGGFEQKLSGLPFDWVIPKSSGVNVGVVAKPGNEKEHVLAVEFGLGRIEFQGVTQMLLLPPGPYSFSAVHRAKISSRRGLVWQLTCIDSGIELGRTPMMLASDDWTTLSFAFIVPDRDCPAQMLRLFHDARTPSEQLASGWSFHDDVQITRAETQ